MTKTTKFTFPRSTMNNLPFTESDLAHLKSLLGGFLMLSTSEELNQKEAKSNLARIDLQVLISICLEHCYEQKINDVWIEKRLSNPEQLIKACIEYDHSGSVWKINPMNALCHLTGDSHINGKDIDEDDFVDKYDHDRGNARDYGCKDMKADIKDPSPEVLTKYGITKEEYRVIAFEIAEALSFGKCGWCV